MLSIQTASATYDLPLHTDELQRRLDALYDAGRLSELIDPHTYLTGLRPYWPTPPDTDWPRPRLGSVYWPVVGMARYAFGCFVVDEYTLGKIRSDLTTADSNVVTLNFYDDPDNAGETARSIRMRVLVTRPLVRTGDDGQPLTTVDDDSPVDAWVMILVDDRYAALTTSLDPGGSATTLSTWTSVFDLVPTLNITDAVEADYLSPGSRWSTDKLGGRSLGWLMDVAALTVGSRIVCVPGGTGVTTTLFYLQRPTPTNAAVMTDVHTAAIADDRFFGGGPITNADVDHGMPLAMRVVFKANTEPLPVVVDVTTGINEFAGATLTHWSDAATTTASADRAALAAQFESDWRDWQHNLYDTTYSGFLDVPQSGFVWAVEWYHSADKGYTKFTRPPHWYGMLMAAEVIEPPPPDDPTDPTPRCSGCDWLAGMGLNRALRVSVAGTLTDLYLFTTDGAVFTSSDILTICGRDFTVTVTGLSANVPQITLKETGASGSTYNAMWSCCGCSFATWAFNKQAICPDERDPGEPCDNTIIIRVDSVTFLGTSCCDNTVGNIPTPFDSGRTHVPVSTLLANYYKTGPLAAGTYDVLMTDWSTGNWIGSPARPLFNISIGPDCNHLTVIGSAVTGLANINVPDGNMLCIEVVGDTNTTPGAYYEFTVS